MRDFDVEALASAYQRSGRMEDAISYYQELIGPKGKVVSWEPQLRWLTAHYTLAGIYLSRGEREKARKTFSLSSFDARDSRKFYVNWSGDCGDSVASSVLANQHLACFQCRQAVQFPPPPPSYPAFDTSTYKHQLTPSLTPPLTRPNTTCEQLGDDLAK
jgi:tetratricopeptide (TPR) repeat protein